MQQNIDGISVWRLFFPVKNWLGKVVGTPNLGWWLVDQHHIRASCSAGKLKVEASRINSAGGFKKDHLTGAEYGWRDLGASGEFNCSTFFTPPPATCPGGVCNEQNDLYAQVVGTLTLDAGGVDCTALNPTEPLPTDPTYCDWIFIPPTAGPPPTAGYWVPPPGWDKEFMTREHYWGTVKCPPGYRALAGGASCQVQPNGGTTLTSRISDDLRGWVVDCCAYRRFVFCQGIEKSFPHLHKVHVSCIKE